MLPPMPMEQWATTKKLYHTRSGAVTPAPVRVPTQSRLSRVSRRLGREISTLPSYILVQRVLDQVDVTSLPLTEHAGV